MKDYFLRFPDRSTANLHLYKKLPKSTTSPDSEQTSSEQTSTVQEALDVQTDSEQTSSEQSESTGHPLFPGQSIQPPPPVDPDEPTPDMVPLFRAMDVIGILYEPLPPESDPEAPPPEPVPLPGWHVNVRAYSDESTEHLQEFMVHPAHPRRLWA